MGSGIGPGLGLRWGGLDSSLAHYFFVFHIFDFFFIYLFIFLYKVFTHQDILTLWTFKTIVIRSFLQINEYSILYLLTI